MTAGDVTGEGFREWGLPPSEAMRRIEHGWSATAAPQLGEVCWLSNTERGDVRAHSPTREG